MSENNVGQMTIHTKAAASDTFEEIGNGVCADSWMNFANFQFNS